VQERQTTSSRNASRPLPAFEIHCAADCKRFHSLLPDEDQEELLRLPAQVKGTLESLSLEPALSRDKRADAIAEDLLGGVLDGDFSQLKAGPRICTVYYYGFLDEGSRHVGTHRCKISWHDGRPLIEKATGERLKIELLPYYNSVWAFMGRTFDSDDRERNYDRSKPVNQFNDSYGNKVGLAVMHESQVYLISINESGFQTFDDTYFELIVIQ